MTRPSPAQPEQGELEHLRGPLVELLAKIEDGPYIGAEGVADSVLELVGRLGAQRAAVVEDGEVADVVAKLRFNFFGPLIERAIGVIERLAAEVAELRGQLRDKTLLAEQIQKAHDLAALAAKPGEWPKGWKEVVEAAEDLVAADTFVNPNKSRADGVREATVRLYRAVERLPRQAYAAAPPAPARGEKEGG